MMLCAHSLTKSEKRLTDPQRRSRRAGPHERPGPLCRSWLPGGEQTERLVLAGLHQELLCDAAEAATTLGCARDAIEFAGRALALDSFSERATRLLMRGHADRGEVPRALSEFERCRILLADTLGVDPSPPTRE